MKVRVAKHVVLFAQATSVGVFSNASDAFGLGTIDQCAPSQRSVSVWPSVPCCQDPKAHISVLLITAAACKMLPLGILGLGTPVHCIPSQCSMRVLTISSCVSQRPTAQTSLDETVTTPKR